MCAKTDKQIVWFDKALQYVAKKIKIKNENPLAKGKKCTQRFIDIINI